MLSDSYVSIQRAFTWFSYQTASFISSGSQTVQKLFPYPWEQRKEDLCTSFVAHQVPEKIRVDKGSKSHLLGKCPAFSLHPPQLAVSSTRYLVQPQAVFCIHIPDHN